MKRYRSAKVSKCIYYQILTLIINLSLSFAGYAATVNLPFNTQGNYGKYQGVIIPIPANTIALADYLQLNEGKRQIQGKYFALALWPSLQNSAKRQYIRLLFIDFNGFMPIAEQLTLTWQPTKFSNKQRNQQTKFNENLSVNMAKYYLTYPSLAWLAKALLLHPSLSKKINQWYIEPQAMYANYVTDRALLADNGYPAIKASQWLYDRPQAIYQLFIMTGEKKWQAKADELIFFYQNNLDSQGRFTLKQKLDIKYLMPKGLLYRFLLSGDKQAKSHLKNIYQASLTWNANYSKRRGFWTERNQAAALNAAISYWELTNDPHAFARIDEIISATIAMTFDPINNWPLRGCPQHAFKAHEGWGDNTPACSPWMMSLLGDALWRFYRLTEDKRAGALLDAFGDFILKYGLYYGDKRVNYSVIPKYLVSMENDQQETLDQWTDRQHTCDVASLLGKSIYIKKQNNKDNLLLKQVFNALLEQCQKSYVKLKNSTKKQKFWSIKPPRRFGWMYSTTSDLPWLHHNINSAISSSQSSLIGIEK
jgi:hypothetical protein